MSGMKASFVGNLGSDVEVQADKAKLSVAIRMSAEYTQWVSVTAWPTKNGGGLEYLGKGKKGDRVVILASTLTAKPDGKDPAKIWWNVSAQAMDCTIVPKGAGKSDDDGLPFCAAMMFFIQAFDPQALGAHEVCAYGLHAEWQAYFHVPWEAEQSENFEWREIYPAPDGLREGLLL